MGRRGVTSVRNAGRVMVAAAESGRNLEHRRIAPGARLSGARLVTRAGRHENLAVVPPRPRSGAARLQRFFLAETPAAGSARLELDEERHVRKVLRMGAGDRLVGLDGRGRAWLLAIRSVELGRLALEVLAEEACEPAPGSAGSTLPHLHLACSLPRGRRSEELVERAIPLGLARLTPLALAHSPPHAQAFSAERFTRLARAACKQSARAWMPELGPLATLEELLARSTGDACLLLAPGAPTGLAELVTRERDSGRGRILLIVGPEGGFDERELAQARAAGALDAALGPSILRIETAAEAALAIALHAWWSANQKAIRSRIET